ncbi:MAG: hypothetical protein QM697_01300 [Lachnospiraceae bacterium]
MMYLHFCKNCQQIFILSGHQQECIKCGNRLDELKLLYHDYVNYSPEQRSRLLSSLEDPNVLMQQRRNYRFSKQTKRYRQWAIKKEDTLPL